MPHHMHPAPVDQHLDGAAHTLALVDDDAQDREKLVVELKSARALEVVAFSSLEEVFALEPSVLVLGAEVSRVLTWVRLARERFCAATIVATGYFSATAAFDIGRAGADALFLKPVTANRLLFRCGLERQSASVRQHWPTLARAEWDYMHAVLADCGGNRSEAARRLGIHRSVLQRKMARHPPRR